MNKPEQDIIQIFCLHQDCEKKKVSRPSKCVLHNQLKILTPTITLNKTMVQSSLQLYKENIKWITNIQRWWLCQSWSCALMQHLFRVPTVARSRIWHALVNSIYVHTISTRKLNYLPTHKPQWRQQIQICGRPFLFQRIFSSHGKKQLWTATFELSHAKCPTVSFPSSWRHTKNVVDP